MNIPQNQIMWQQNVICYQPVQPVQGFPSVDGDYQFAKQELLNNNQYVVVEYLGRGSFGKVVKCLKMAGNKMTKECVAIKIVNNRAGYASFQDHEETILSKLSHKSMEEFNLIRMHESFDHNGHKCFVFDLMRQNLRDYLHENGPMPVLDVRAIIQQILKGLTKLKELGLIHTDLKPENIMMVDSVGQPFRVKIIDFGSACYVDQVKHRQNNCSPYKQTRFYRSPEIILGLPFGLPIDMWSVGCIVAELFVGSALYPGLSEYDQIRYISQTQGQPPQYMLNSANKTQIFFYRDTNSTLYPFWRLKTPAMYSAETGKRVSETRPCILNRLEDLDQLNILTQLKGKNISAEGADRQAFVDLLQLMMAIDPKKRITPDDALQQPFITMSHLIDYAQSSYVMASVKKMEVCSRYTPHNSLLQHSRP